MRDYWLTRELLQLAGWTYVAVFIIAAGLALWLPKRGLVKFLCAALVAGVMSMPLFQGRQEAQEQQVKVDAYKERYAKAKALFDERCKTAGEKIYRTVEGVEGVLLMKVRPDKINFSDQYAMDDPYGRDLGGKGYIGSFLRASVGASLNSRVAEGRRHKYSYVEAIESSTGKWFRYTGVIKAVDGRDPNFELEVMEVASPLARYGVTYEDISTREERKNWIAGGLLKVVDSRTNEVITQRIGYIFDPGLGNTDGGRGPWEAAIACEGAVRNYGHNSIFVMKSLKPTKAE